jgi:adenylate kinase family enzyme
MANIIVVHGAPGAGKTTLSKYLSQIRADGKPVYHISSGEQLRAIRTGEIISAFSQQVNDPNAPLRLDNRLVDSIIFEFVQMCPDDSVVLIDGYPRFPDAVDTFLETAKDKGHKFLGCVNFEITKDTSFERLNIRGIRRGERIIGETSEIVDRRYTEHELYTRESIQMLKKIALVVTIDASKPKIDVFRQFYNAVSNLISGI